MPLFDPVEHEPLTTSRWDESRVGEGVARIVADTVDASEPGLSGRKQSGISRSGPAPPVSYGLSIVSAPGAARAASTTVTSHSLTSPSRPD